MPSVLVVDDVRELRTIVRTVLQTGGAFQVVAEAVNGAQAVKLAAIHRPDVVVLDLAMPVMSGVEALAELREVVPDAKVVLLSGLARTEIDDAFPGPDAFVDKADLVRDLPATVARLCATETTVETYRAAAAPSRALDFERETPGPGLAPG